MKGFQLQCYFNCLTQSGIIYLISILIILTILFIIGYMFIRKPKLILTAQMITTVVIGLNFVSMKCDTFQLIWIYLGLVFGGGLLIWTAKRHISLQCQDTINTPNFISKFEKKFNVNVRVLPLQRIKAFVYQDTIYITMGLLERLNQNELEAVLAHEVYHVRNSPNKLLSSILALTSLTFKRHNDDFKADKFASKSMGANSLISAFRKLEIVDREDRINKLFT